MPHRLRTAWKALSGRRWSPRLRSAASALLSGSGPWPWVRRGLGVAALVLMIVLVHRQVTEFLANEMAPRLDDPQLTQVDLPEWIWEMEGAEGLARRLGRLRAPILDEEATRRAAEELERNPWVERVLSIRRVAGNQIEVSLELREPYAQVRIGEWIYLVDAQGRRLPGQYEQGPSRPPAPAIRAWDANPPEVATVWSTGGVPESLAMVQLHDRSPLLARLGIAEIEPIEDADGAHLVLRLANGCRIAWGSPPDARRAGEPSVERKLTWLLEHCERYPGLAECESLKLDTTAPARDRVVVRRPLGSGR